MGMIFRRPKQDGPAETAPKQSDAPPAPAGHANHVCGEALRLLASQDLPPTPENYELAFTAVSLPKSLTARAFDAILMSGGTISPAEAERMSKALRAEQAAKNEEEPLERAQLRLEALRVSEATTAVMQTTSNFGRSLDEGMERLAPEGESVRELISAMIQHVGETEKKLSAASRTIDNLRTEIETARGDAARDALTGIPNRRGLEEAIAALPKTGQHCLAICDIDRFKRVNDTYGHVVGDRVLKLVANSLKDSCGTHLVGRWGGEEFMVLLASTDVATATATLEKALADLSQRNVKLRATDQPLGPVTFSAGVAAFTGNNCAAAVQEADALLYQAKEAGRAAVFRAG